MGHGREMRPRVEGGVICVVVPGIVTAAVTIDAAAAAATVGDDVVRAGAVVLAVGVFVVGIGCVRVSALHAGDFCPAAVAKARRGQARTEEVRGQWQRRRDNSGTVGWKGQYVGWKR